MKLHYLYASVICFLLCSCTSEPTPEPEPETIAIVKEMYFPPLTGNDWETISLEELNWNANAVDPLFNFLELTKTDAFIVLQNGRIVLEKYFGGFLATQPKSWNSAAKTLTSMTVGIAEEEGLLYLTDSSSDYLGTGWSSLTPEQEMNITIWHHLTMTTGLDYTVPQPFCTSKACFLYKNDAGAYWYYHQGAYTVLDDIIASAVNQDFQDYFNAKIKERIGMTGTWIKSGDLNLFYSNARSMARFGLLNLNKGVWNTTTILNNTTFFTDATTTSQELNPAYGYLYWLNGKNAYKIPDDEAPFQGKLIPNAPNDLFAGLGALDQKLYIVPSKKLVIIRMGGSGSEDALGPTTYDNELWEYINAVIE